MEVSEIQALTQAAVSRLLEERSGSLNNRRKGERRALPRWPFPGTVEMWIPDEEGHEHYTLATSLDLSLSGAGIRSDAYIKPGTKLAVAFHEPEVSFHGQGLVRHCSEVDDQYLIGLEFVFDDDITK